MQNDTEQPPPGILKSVKTLEASSQDTQVSQSRVLRFFARPRRQSSYAAGAFSGFRRIAIVIWDHADTWWASVVSWIILILMLYLTLYMISKPDMGVKGQLFRILAMIVGAQVAGLVLQQLTGLPALLGMLLIGCLLRNLDFYHPTTGSFAKQTRVFKQLATTVGMVKAGMRLVPDAIYSALHCHHGLRLAGLGMVPSFMEAVVTLIVSYQLLGFPPLWACCLGFLLCATSPSVITPPMVWLMDAGYGEEKNIGVLVHGAAGLDVAFSISIFDICLALLFREREMDPAQMVGKGSVDVLIDLGGGFFLGLIAGFLPVQDNELAVWKRAVAVLAGGMIAVVSGPTMDLPGTGPLSCICTSFVASMLWKLQAPLSSTRTVQDIMQVAWVVLCPMLFAFTGSDIDLRSEYIDLDTWFWMLLIVLLSIIVRLLGCFLVLCGGEFSWKEMLFVGLIFQGKATTQATLGPQILYAATDQNDPDDTKRAMRAVAMGAISILICTPLAHLGAKLGGPCLLTRKPAPRRPPPDLDAATLIV